MATEGQIVGASTSIIEDYKNNDDDVIIIILNNNNYK